MPLHPRAARWRHRTLLRTAAVARAVTDAPAVVPTAAGTHGVDITQRPDADTAVRTHAHRERYRHVLVDE